MNTYVEAITEVDHGNGTSSVFIGGDFEYLESSTGERVAQSNIAAFDPETGELRRDFKLTVNGQVKAVEALPNNRLAVGGAFTLVNGKKHESFVVLMPRLVKLPLNGPRLESKIVFSPSP